MKNCKYCKFEVADDSLFCVNCGRKLNDDNDDIMDRQPTKFEKRCKTCGAVFRKGLNKCPNCGANAIQLIPAKLTKCKHCNHDMAKNALKCPGCGRHTKQLFIIILSCILIIPLLMPTFLSTNTNNSEPAVSDAKNSENNNENSGEAEQGVLYSDDFFTIEYMKLYDVSIVSTSYLQLKITNRSTQKVTLLLDDVYVNDIAIESGTAMPIDLESGKKSTTPFILFTGNTGLSADDITKVEFKLKGYDDNLNVIHKTPKITIER